MNTHATIHIARKQLGLDDDTARDVYEQTTGKRSLRTMSESERLKVISAFEKRGFNRHSTSRIGTRKKLSGKYAKKLQALWIAGWNLGIIHNNNDAALIAFVKGQTGIDQVQWVNDAGDAAKAIEALKSWIARRGSVEWSVSEWDPPYASTPGFKIAWAQWLKLGNDAHVHSVNRFWEFVADTLGENDLPALLERGPDTRQWIAVMNELGKRVRSQG